MCDACPEMGWWTIPVLAVLLYGPFLVGAALPMVAAVRRRRTGRGLVLALAALVPAALLLSGERYLLPFIGFPQLAYILLDLGRAPLAEITSLVIGAVGAASLLSAPRSVAEPAPR